MVMVASHGELTLAGGSIMLRVNFASLTNPLLTQSLSFGGWPPLGSLVSLSCTIFFPFFNNGFNGAPQDIQSFVYILVTKA